MKSIDLAEEICDEIKKFRDWVQAEGDLIARKKESGDESYIPDEMHFDSKYTGESIHIEQLLVDLYKNSVKDNFYFYDCPLRVYKHHYKSRLNEYLEEYIDADELDFIQDEIENFNKPLKNRCLFNSCFYAYFVKFNKAFSQTLKKKQKLLNQKKSQIKDKKTQTIENENLNKENLKAKDYAEIIAKRIYKFTDYEEKEAELIRRKKESFGAVNYSKEEKQKLAKDSENLEKEIVEKETEIKELLKQLYYKSVDDNFYFFDCPKTVYENTLQERYSNYKQKFLDATYKDFLQNEMYKFDTPYNNRYLFFDSRKVKYTSFIDYSNEIFRMSNEKKVEFLKKEIELFNKLPKEQNKPKQQKEPSQVKQPTTQNTILTSEQKIEKQLTSNQIILLFDKIGFFTIEKIENTSKVKQAELISKISGLNAKNIKNKIQNLDKSPNELGAQHQKDIDKIDNILDKLE